ncbi:MAG: aminoacyl-tRNA hydrolase [Candidatus Nealsonbacteria bacterium]|nr:aminoacyl-tRNA hydrolase [Candidatus Nealsonbacteria bacterium]
MIKPRALIVGLGNPGKEYQKTWHSLGFLALDEFARQNGFPDFQPHKWSDSLVSQNKEIILAKPQTFMNESGRAVKSLVSNFIRQPADQVSNLVVVHDDADLPKGEMRISKDRGTAGHKGIDSIVKALKSKNFVRIRIGVRPANYVPGSKSLDRFVLKKFTKNEERIVTKVIKKTVEAIGTILKDGATESMTRFN